MPQSGELLDRRGFDTTSSGNEAEAAALAGFVAGVRQGQIVVVALQGDGAAHLTEEAVAALRAVGGQADLRDTSGWSQAIIGVKGAAPGTALEAAGPGTPGCASRPTVAPWPSPWTPSFGNRSVPESEVV